MKQRDFHHRSSNYTGRTSLTREAVRLDEVSWRGLIYGSVDALLLTAFPGAIAFSVLAGRLEGMERRASFALLAADLIIVITGAYHLGYQQFRADAIGNREIRNAAIPVPLLLTRNPPGSVVAHATMHGTADVHSYETNVFLPPQTNAP